VTAGDADELIEGAPNEWQAWAERELWPRCDIDLGNNHRLQFIWKAGVARVGSFVVHRRDDGLICLATIMFDCPGGNVNGFTVLQDDPLTVLQSVLCRACNDHGFIRDGKWVPAG